MKLKTIITFLFLFCAFSISASGMSETQKQDIINRINKAASGMKSMSCSFTQTKHLSMLSDKMESQGKMYYKQPNKLRWEYISPYKYLFVFNGTRVYIGNNSRNDVIDTQSNKIFKEVARLMMSTVTGTALSNTTDFTIDIADGSSVWNVTLIPKKKDMKKMFSKITLSFLKTDLMISEINIFEKNSDRTNIKLKNTSVNCTLNENLFAIPK